MCQFTALAMHWQGQQKLEAGTSKLFNLILETNGGTDPANFQGVRMKILQQWRTLFKQTFFCMTFTL